jgi:hypothetical protein
MKMIVIAQIQAIRDSLTRLLGKVKITDGTNDAVVTSGGRLKVEAALLSNADDCAKRIDWDSASVLYTGWAAAGAAESAGAWKIRRRTFSGDDFVDEWADGNTDFDNVWNNRTSLSYS